MIETLLPLFFSPYGHTHIDGRTLPENPAPIMRYEDRMSDQPNVRLVRSNPQEVRRKGYQASDENYFKKRMEYAVRKRPANFEGIDTSQRVLRTWVRRSTRSERILKDYPQGCRFPCTETTDGNIE